MQEVRQVCVNGHEVPVLISDEKGALLAAKAAGRAIIGLWRPGQTMDEISCAKYVVEDMESITNEYLERVARRYMGFPWHICETERLLIREMFADDFDEVWNQQIGHGFGSIEELETYTKHQYEFYEFGFWALVEKTSGDLIGIAGLKVPDLDEDSDLEWYCLEMEDDMENDEIPELGYHIFRAYRRRGYAMEACRNILEYGREAFGITKYLVRIARDNEISKQMAGKLGFKAGDM